MIHRLRDRVAGRLTAALISVLVLQLTAVTHLHVAHQSGLDGAAGTAIAPGCGSTVAHDSTVDEHPPSCPICLIRAQTYSFAAATISTELTVERSQHPRRDDASAPLAAADHSPAAPRGPPTSFT